jgi:hypothetical protein
MVLALESSVARYGGTLPVGMITSTHSALGSTRSAPATLRGGTKPSGCTATSPVGTVISWPSSSATRTREPTVSRTRTSVAGSRKNLLAGSRNPGSGDAGPQITRSVSLIAEGPVPISAYRGAAGPGARSPTGVDVSVVTGSGAAGGAAAGSCTGCDSRAVRRPTDATSSYVGGLFVGMGRNARNAPFGQTGAGTPLIVRKALPFPSEPKMNAESVEATVSPRRGYTTLMANGPCTSGIGGRLGFTGAAGRTGTTATRRSGAHADAANRNAMSRRLRTVGIMRLHPWGIL